MNAVQLSRAEVTPRASTTLRHRDQDSADESFESGAAETLEINIVDPTRDSRWDVAVSSYPQSSVFHGAGWASVLRETYGHQPAYISADRGGKSAVVLPIMEVTSRLTGRRGVALPFSDFCGGLFSDGFEMKTLTKRLATIARERAWKYLEVRDGSGFQSEPESPATFYGHKLRLKPNAEDLREGFSGAIRRGLGKAERSDLTVEITQADAGVFEFYKLHLETRRRHGAPPQPLRFFNNIYRYVIKPEMGFCVLAKLAARPIAAAIFFLRGKNAIYKFGASDERFQEYRANNLVMWEAIKHLCSQGAQSLHFGRTSPANEGLRRFKLGWGAAEEAIHYRRLNPASEQWTSVPPDSPSFTQHIFRKMPMSFNRWAGSLLYPHLD